MKKLTKYVPATKYPRTRVAAHKAMVDAGYKLADVVTFIRDRNAKTGRGYYSKLLRLWDEKQIDDNTIFNYYNKHGVMAMYDFGFPASPLCDTLNEKFLAEYDSRSDLKEIYDIAVGYRGYLYDRFAQFIEVPTGNNTGHPLKERPESFQMFDDAVRRSTEARKYMEQNRATPYQEGDLVLLRDVSIGNRDVDPLWVPTYGVNAGITPDKTTQRIGTVISVTDKLDGWRYSRGSKIIKVMWIGAGDGKIFDIPEKHIKFHQRPTYKNGMKVRE